jgi:hypothetical protein
MRRTLVSLDHDYLDDRTFPPAQTAGILVLSAPDERHLARLLTRIDRLLFRAPAVLALPLDRRKLDANVDWAGDPGPARG